MPDTYIATYLFTPNFLSPLANHGSMMNTALNLVLEFRMASLSDALSCIRRELIRTQCRVVGGWHDDEGWLDDGTWPVESVL